LFEMSAVARGRGWMEGSFEVRGVGCVDGGWWLDVGDSGNCGRDDGSSKRQASDKQAASKRQASSKQAASKQQASGKQAASKQQASSAASSAAAPLPHRSESLCDMCTMFVTCVRCL